MNTAFDDNGQQVGVVPFDYAAVEADRAAQLATAADLTVELERDRLSITKIMRWIYQCGMNDPRGFMHRTKLVAWYTVPEIQESYTLTELAGESGCAKQSFGRWNDVLKRKFPLLINIHNR